MNDFLEQAWTDHAEHADAVADRLSTALDLVHGGDDAQGLARLAVHVFGEHLGQWQRGIAYIEALAARCASFDDDATARALARSTAALRLAHGAADAANALARDDRVAAQAVAAAALAGRGEWRRAIALYEEALGIAQGGLPDGSPAIRALAVAGNNLAAGLEEKRERDATETQGMVRAARGGLEWWRRAGTWLEHERAQYRLAMSLLAAGRTAEATDAARACIDVCIANDAPAFERFFGFAALARALRAAGDAQAAGLAQAEAMSAYAAVAPEERAWCAADLAALEGRAA